MEHRAISGMGRDGMSAAPAPSLIERELAAIACAFALWLRERGVRIENEMGEALPARLLRIEAGRFARGE